ncbi:MAG: CBS domain-containing protein, partial [Proteobacteria bacterium]|nr:CBS domain-containing protein [Pseudomonadota bacterium]
MEIIACHTNADFDTFASMIAAGKLYPGAKLVVPGSLERALREAVESVKLDIKTYKVTDIDLELVTRLILVDISGSARIGKLKELTNKKGVDIHIYDHHPKSNDDLPASLLVNKRYGSTTTILTLIIKERTIKLTKDEATVLMAGIYEDTGFLSFPSTCGEDYEAASFLLSSGADLTLVSKLLKSQVTSEEIRILNKLLDSQENINVEGQDILIASAVIDDFKGEVSELAHSLFEVDNPDALFVLVGVGDRIHLVARSKVAQINVGLVAKAMGGGGHPNAASATIKGLTLVETKEKLIEMMRSELASKRTAMDMMSAPPIIVTTDTTITKAWDILLNFNVNAMPVVDGDSLKGVITRQVISKAIFHELGSMPVKDYMTIDVEYVNTRTSIDKIREKVFARGQRLLPVCRGKKVIGVITRTD